MSGQNTNNRTCDNIYCNTDGCLCRHSGLGSVSKDKEVVAKSEKTWKQVHSAVQEVAETYLKNNPE